MILAIIKNLLKLVRHLEETNPSDDRVMRLAKKFKPKQISESVSGTKYTSYSVNKGEKIVFCVRSKTKAEKLVSINTMMFVAIHELAHVMTKSVGHTDEFWSNMRYLLREAIDINLYKVQNFRKKPITYCGTKITDSPLEMTENPSQEGE